MDDVSKINKELDKLDVLWKQKNKQVEELIAQRDEETDPVRKTKLREEVIAAGSGRENIENKRNIQLRKLARTTLEGQELEAKRKNIGAGKEKIIWELNEMGKTLREQYLAETIDIKNTVEPQSKSESETSGQEEESEPITENENFENEYNKDEEASLKENWTDELKNNGNEKSENMQELIDLIEGIGKIRENVKENPNVSWEDKRGLIATSRKIEGGLLNVLNLMKGELNLDIQDVQDVVAEPEKSQDVVVEPEESQDIVTEPEKSQDEIDIIAYIENIKLDFEEMTDDTIRESMISLLEKLEDSVSEKFKVTNPEQEETQESFNQKGIDIIADIRNLADEYEDKFKEAFGDLSENELRKGIVSGFKRLEEIVVGKFGLNQEEEVTEVSEVMMQQIDEMMENLEVANGDALKEKMLASLVDLQNTVSEEFELSNQTQDVTNIMDTIDGMMNYIDSHFVPSEDELKKFIKEDLEEIKKTLLKKREMISQEQEELPEEEQSMGIPGLNETVTVATEWRPGVQKVENLEEGENFATSTETPEQETPQEIEAKKAKLNEKVSKIDGLIAQEKRDLEDLKKSLGFYPEGSDERNKIEEKIHKTEYRISILNSQARKEQNVYKQLVDQGNSRKEKEQEKKPTSAEKIVHIKGIKDPTREAQLRELLEKSRIMEAYKSQFDPKSNIPDMPLEEIGSLMKDVKRYFKKKKNETKRRTPERKQAKANLRKFNQYKKQIKEMVKSIEREKYFVDDYEPEM